MVESTSIHFQTRGRGDVIDITQRVAEAVARSRIQNGIATLFVIGSTAALTTIEAEGALISDFQALWERLIPSNVSYKHDQTWGDANGFSHLRASLLGASLTVPFVNGQLTLGTWQQIIFVDFDNRPRSRELVLQLLGD